MSSRTLDPDVVRANAAPAPKARTEGEGRPDHDAVLALQRTAGNQAVASLVGGSTVQREPNDKPKDTSPVATGQTVVGTGTPPPSPVAVADTIAGTGTPPPSQAHIRGRAVPVDEAEVKAAYAKNPNAVVRSPHANWHAQIYYLDKGTGGIPAAFRSGNYIFVTPDEHLPASTLPSYGPTDVIDLAPAKPKLPEQPPPPPADVRAPTFVTGGGQPTGGGGGPRAQPNPRFQNPSHTPAVPATDDEVAAAYKKNPQSVWRSNSHDWHEQIYDLDKGKGDEYPRAFKSGNVYIVAPDYKGPASKIPDHLGEEEGAHDPKGGAKGGGGGTTGAPAPPATPAAPATPATPTTAKGPAPMPTAGQTVNIPGAVHDERSAGKAYSAVVTENKGKTEVRDRKRELGMVTHGEEVQEGELTRRTEKKRGVGVGVGGNVVGVATGKQEITKVDDGSLSTAKGHQTAVGVTGKGELQVGHARNQEIVYGTKPDGTPLKKSSATNVNATIDPSGKMGAGGTYTRTGPSGNQTQLGGNVSVDSKGNTSVTGTAGVTSQGGHSASVSVSAGHTVSADEPVEVAEGVWEVRYVVTDSESVGAGGSVRAPGGVGIGVSGSVTDADLKTGSRQFKTEKEANEFRKSAAERIVKDGSLGYFPLTTAVGALSIPIGEARGIGSSHGKAGGASVTFGATVGKSGHTTDTGEMSVRRVSAGVVHVTATVVSESGSDWSISGGLTNEKGGSESTLYAVTYAFDLHTREGIPAYERFVKFPLPPGPAGKRISVRNLGTQEDHDKYALLGGNSSWTGTTWQDKVQDEQGEHDKYGGKQSRDQDPGRIWKALGDKELHSNAQIVRSVENGEDAGARAEMTVSGESGDFNREEFGKIFMGAKFAGDAKASGSWKLTAQVPMERIRELEKVEPRLRNAVGIDEKMKIYSELVKENGARMLGGQVGMESKAWNLELKGDENFPGEKGRARLNQLRKSLSETLKKSPDSANTVITQATEELDKLKKRREAVADMKRYTDLPDGLRKQQLGVIDRHIEELTSVRRQAQAVAMKRDPTDKGAGAADRLKKDNYDLELKKSDREDAKFRDQVQTKEATITKLRKDIHDFSKALGDAIGAKGTTALKFHVDSQVASAAIGLAKGFIAQATGFDKSQAALDPKIDAARDAWTAATDPAGRLSAVKTLDGLLSDRIKLMNQCIWAIREAGKAVFPITTKNAKSGDPYFWGTLGMVEDEPAEREPAHYTPMAL